MNTGTAVKLAVVLIAAYLIYHYYTGSQTAGAAAQIAPPAPPAPPAPYNPPPPAAAAAPAPDATTRALLAQWAATVPSYAAAGTLTAFEWLYGYNHVRNTNIQDTGYADGTIEVSLDEFLANAATKAIGLAGMVRATWGI
jgi:hypothetical protein